MEEVHGRSQIENLYFLQRRKPGMMLIHFKNKRGEPRESREFTVEGHIVHEP